MQQSSTKHLHTGRHGERLAKEFLAQKGYAILEQNWRYKRDEVDIIAGKNGLIIFLEVKTRTGIGFGHPEEFVTIAKEKNLERASAAYIEEKNHQGEIRFDIISITFDKQGRHEIYHIEDAFFPGV